MKVVVKQQQTFQRDQLMMPSSADISLHPLPHWDFPLKRDLARITVAGSMLGKWRIRGA